MSSDSGEKSKYGPYPFEVFDQPEGDWAAYNANCHCGDIKFKLTIAPPFPKHLVVDCNCSICRRNEYLLIYPKRENLQFVCGVEKMKGYRFNSLKSTHKFCPSCSSSLYIDFNKNERVDVLGVNVSLIRTNALLHRSLNYFRPE